jgi:inner membrane protein
MDNLTHTAVGLFLSRAGLNRWTPYATPIILVAANLPDADVACAAGGSIGYLNFHRHLTHSLIAAPVIAILSALAVRAIARKPIHWAGAFAAALLGVASHLALDWTNVYGVRLLLPFSAEWLHADITSVVDLWIWGVCLLCLAGPFLSRLVSSEIGASTRGRSYGRGWAIFGLLFLLVYDGGRWVAHGRATAILESRLYENEAPLRVVALPSAINPLAWRGVVETTGSFRLLGVNLLGEFDPTAGATCRKPDPDPALEAARAAPIVADFVRFSLLPYWRVTPLAEPAGARLVEAIDLRFGTPAEPGFMASAIVTAQGQVVGPKFQFGLARRR